MRSSDGAISLHKDLNLPAPHRQTETREGRGVGRLLHTARSKSRSLSARRNARLANGNSSRENPRKSSLHIDECGLRELGGEVRRPGGNHNEGGRGSVLVVDNRQGVQCPFLMRIDSAGSSAPKCAALVSPESWLGSTNKQRFGQVSWPDG
jgi:hypothetical protein